MNKKLLLILIIFLGFVLRSYAPRQLFMYSHDQDLSAWFVSDVVYNRDLRLVGQETSVGGVFIGPLFYYALLPFYILFGMNPLGGVLMVILIGTFSVWSFYYVFKKIFSENIGLVAAAIHASSFYTVLTEREVVPTMPVFLWSAWFLYSLHLLLGGKQKQGFLVLGILASLIWHLNLGLILTMPIALVALLLSKKKIDFKALMRGILFSIPLLMPFVLFEVRNGFLQTKSILSSAGGGEIVFSEKLDRTITLLAKNIRGLMWGNIRANDNLGLYLILFLFVFIIAKRLIDKRLATLLAIWTSVFIIFYSLNALNLSEYYLNATGVIWILILSVSIAHFIDKKYFYLGLIPLFAFISFNIYRLYSMPVSKNGYIEKRALIREIKSDAESRGYPCISISYITEPGYNLGYRYLFRIENMHVNNPSSLSPVYTIVFPHSLVDEIDKSFGALGLIYPDYPRYNNEEVAKTCVGENSNLTDPLFGFVD